MNLFRCGTKDGSLDKSYLRVCSVYRLLKKGAICKARGIELLNQRRVPNANALVELWQAYPLKHMREAR